VPPEDMARTRAGFTYHRGRSGRPALSKLTPAAVAAQNDSRDKRARRNYAPQVNYCNEFCSRVEEIPQVLLGDGHRVQPEALQGKRNRKIQRSDCRRRRLPRVCQGENRRV